MEPKTQVEIQLGHMCNNRCVFCVSGQETGFGRALPAPVEPILHRISEAHASGHRKLTLLGGEPTLQPGFLEVVRHAVSLGFEEIVVFTNGVKTARRGFIEEVVATGGRFTFRISIQGATKEAHERTTRRPGSFDRILRSMEHLREMGQRITVNMCVVGSNYESIEHFPALLAEHGVSQLHLDMVRPMDAGERTEAEFADMMVRYTELVPGLRKLTAGVPPDFDVNVGNLPYCVAPDLAPWIHHDGETTYTVAVDGKGSLSRPWNKYFVKRRDKDKPETCRQCVFDSRCNGVFEKYRELHGYGELVPVSAETLARLDTEKKLLGVHLAARLSFLGSRVPPPPFTSVTVASPGEREVRVTLAGTEPLVAVLRAPGGGAGSFDEFAVDLAALPAEPSVAKAGLVWLFAALSELGHRVLHPLGEDAIDGAVQPSIRARLRRLRRAAPHGAVEWGTLTISADGRRAELGLVAGGDEPATFWLEDRAGVVTAGYAIPRGTPSPALTVGLRSMFAALGPPSLDPPDPPRDAVRE